MLQLLYVCVFLWFAVGAARRYAFFVLAPVLFASALMVCLVVTKVIWGSPFVAAVAAWHQNNLDKENSEFMLT